MWKKVSHTHTDNLSKVPLYCLCVEPSTSRVALAKGKAGNWRACTKLKQNKKKKGSLKLQEMFVMIKDICFMEFFFSFFFLRSLVEEIYLNFIIKTVW